MPNYPKEQLWELYKDLPKDLQETAFSKKVAANIQEICFKNEVTNDGLIFDIAKNIGYIFLGLLPPNELQDVLEKELKIEKSKAEQIASEITRFIFLPVKKSLEALYKIEIKPGLKAKATSLLPKTKLSKKKSKKGDKYRELIE